MIEQLMSVYNGHRYESSRWSSQSGYIVECRCGSEFTVGHIPDKVILPDPPRRLSELDTKYSLGPISIKEHAERKKLRNEYDQVNSAAQQENRQAELSALHGPIQQHVREEFKKVIKKVTTGNLHL